MSCWPAGVSRAAEASCPVPRTLFALPAAPAADGAAAAADALPDAGTAAPSPLAAPLLDPPPEQPASAAMAMTMSPGTKAAPSRRRKAPICLFRMPL